MRIALMLFDLGLFHWMVWARGWFYPSGSGYPLPDLFCLLFQCAFLPVVSLFREWSGLRCSLRVGCVDLLRLRRRKLVGMGSDFSEPQRYRNTAQVLGSVRIPVTESGQLLPDVIIVTVTDHQQMAFQIRQKTLGFFQIALNQQTA